MNFFSKFGLFKETLTEVTQEQIEYILEHYDFNQTKKVLKAFNKIGSSSLFVNNSTYLTRFYQKIKNIPNAPNEIIEIKEKTLTLLLKCYEREIAQFIIKNNCKSLIRLSTQLENIDDIDKENLHSKITDALIQITNNTQNDSCIISYIRKNSSRNNFNQKNFNQLIDQVLKNGNSKSIKELLRINRLDKMYKIILIDYLNIHTITDQDIYEAVNLYIKYFMKEKDYELDKKFTDLMINKLRKYKTYYKLDNDIVDEEFIITKYTHNVLNENLFNYILKKAQNMHTFDFVFKIYKYLPKKLNNKILDKNLLKAVIADANTTNNFSYLIRLFSKQLLNNISQSELSNIIFSNVQTTHNLTLIIDIYRYFPKDYQEQALKVIMDQVDLSNDYSYILQFFNKYGSSYNYAYEKSVMFKYLISKGEVEELYLLLEYFNIHGQDNELASTYITACVKRERLDLVKNVFKKNEFAITHLSYVPKEQFIRLLIGSNNTANDNMDFLFILWLEAFTILQQYSHVNFLENPEVNQCKNSKDYTKFHSCIKKILKSGKTVLALYILNNYGDYESKSDIKLWIDNYIETFVLLERVDILAHYYSPIGNNIQNLDLLQSIVNHYIEVKNTEQASLVLKEIERIEPKYPFIKIAREEIEKLAMIRSLGNNNIDINSLNTLSGENFENLLIENFEKLGFTTHKTPRTGDFGADIIVETADRTKVIIQCKRFKSKVNLKAVQEVVGALAHYAGDIGIVITNSGFLSSAIKLAKSNEIELWDNLKLMKFLAGDISFSQLSDL